MKSADAPAQARESAFERLVNAEMRTPLEGVVALAELLERQPLGGDGHTYVRTIAEHSRGLLRLLSDAADLGRASRGELVLAPEPVRLRDLLDEVQAEWMPRAQADGVGLGAFYDGDPALNLELDPARLRQVFAILVAEALRFTRRGGVEIGLSAVRESGRAVLHGHVRDTGPTLDAAELALLFAPETSTAAPRGSMRRAELAHGLCRALLETMGGRIWAEPNPGDGLTVRFTFEARVAVALGEAGEDASEPVLAGRVLIVDDNATNRMVAQTLVEMFGCSCETATDGLEAVEAVRRGRFDAVLMDIRMPGMDGMEATRAIHALPASIDLPIIALTANAGREDVKSYLQAGMRDVVEKPIKADRLLSALQAAMAPSANARASAAA